MFLIRCLWSPPPATKRDDMRRGTLLTLMGFVLFGNALRAADVLIHNASMIAVASRRDLLQISYYSTPVS
jgi:hypothetical protein